MLIVGIRIFLKKKERHTVPIFNPEMTGVGGLNLCVVGWGRGEVL